jgi:hypothetical protein
MADEQRKGWLDRSRDHASVYGDDQGRMWEQDGKHFNGDGSPWRDPSGRKAAPAAAPAPAAEAAALGSTAADDQLSQQLRG